jgi:hypothetical protein
MDADPVDGYTDHVTHGDSVRVFRRPGANHALMDRRYRFALPWPAIHDESTIRLIARLQALPVETTLAYWKPVATYYVATSGQTAFFLPRRRQNAPQVLGQSLTAYPLVVTLNGDELTTEYVDGNDPTVPEAGTVNLASAVYGGASQYKDSVMFRTSARTAGDVLWVEHVPLFLVRTVGMHEAYPGGFRESRALFMMER